MTDSEFAAACADAFRRLQIDFGFDPPETERVGRELFVRWHRGPDTLSISLEPELRPIVEVFAPVEILGSPSVPWAAASGVERGRLIPRLVVPGAFRTDSAAAVQDYLSALAHQAETVLADFLATGRRPDS